MGLMGRMGRRVVLLSVMALQAMAGVAQTVSRQYDLLFMEAMVQRQKGHSDAAFDLLDRCRQLKPEASEAYFFMGQYCINMGKGEMALDLFKRAASLEPKNATYMETLAEAYIEAGQTEQAVEAMEQLYQADKGRQDLLQTIYRLYVQQGEYAKAIDVVQRMEAIDGTSEQLSATKSQLYMQLGENERALDEMKALADSHPNDLTYHTLYAKMLLMDSRPDEAADVLKAVLSQEPDNTRAQMTLRAYHILRNEQEKVDSLTRCVLLNQNTSQEEKVFLLRQEISTSEQEGGDSTKVLRLFSEILAQPDADADMAEMCAAYMSLKKMPRDSISAMLGLVLQLAPDNASARLQLVQYAWDDEDDDRVVELCRAARQYNPEEMAFYYYQGMAFYRQDNHDQALDAFQQGISVITPESPSAIVSSFYEVMGDLLHQKGLKAEAYAAYDSCLQWKPDNIGCLNNYAYYLSVEGEQLERAEQMSYRTIKAEPDNATYLDTYAWILFMQQRYSEARIYIDQAMKNDTLQSSVITEHGGDIYMLCGQPDRALELWQQALAKDPQNKVLIRKIKRKKYIRQ